MPGNRFLTIAMPTSPNQVLVSVSGQTAFFRLRGRATAAESTGFKSAAEALRGHSHHCFLIDLTECQSMDSTFIGVLAGLSRRVRQDAGDAGYVELINTTPQVRRQLDDLFVLDQFRLTECGVSPGTPYAQIQSGPANKAELCRVMLEAHQTLMDLHCGNVPKFKQVTQFLQEDLEKLGDPAGHSAPPAQA